MRRGRRRRHDRARCTATPSAPQFFYTTAALPCPYVAGRTERKLVTELGGPEAEAQHDRLSRAGFRRSHNIAYAPVCPGCQSCVPIRILADRFRPDRTQRKLQRINADLAAQETPARATAEQFALFQRYQQARHGDGDMAAMGFYDYRAMVEDTPITTALVEFREPSGRLVACCLTDWLSDGLSVVYSFYDPEQPRRSLGTALCFPVAFLRASTRGHVTLSNLLEALVEGAKGAIGVAMACACAGIVIGIIALTGLGIVSTQLVVNVSGSSLFLALLLTMAAGIILGMGMPTTPAYIVMVSLLVPAIIRLGVEPAAAHMFAFYFAILSAITPPVALAVFAAAGLAKSDLWPSGWAAVKIGAADFIVPFIFVYEPALLLIGPLPHSLHAAASAFLGATLLAAALHGWLFGLAGLWQRAVLFAAALSLIQPGGLTDLVGLGLAAIVAAVQIAARRRGAPASSLPGG